MPPPSTQEIKHVASLRIFALILLLLWPVSSPAQNKDIEVQIGVLAKRGTSLCMKRWEPTVAYLNKTMPGHNFTIVPLSFDQIVPAVQGQEIDFLLVNSAIFAGLEKSNGASCIATMETLLNGQKSTQFGGVIFTRKDNMEIDTLQSLKGKHFAAVDRTSLGGWIMALREFKLHKLDPMTDFASITFTGTHDAVVYEVLAGRVDAGTVRTDTLERMAFEGKISTTDFKVLPFHHQHYKHDVDDLIYHRNKEPFPFLHSTHIYPEWPFVKLNHTSRKLAKDVACNLYAMAASSPAAKAAHIAGWTIPLQYQSVRECLQELHLWPYENIGKIYLRDVLRKYCLPICVSLLLLCASLVISLYIGRVNKALALSKKRLKRAYRKQEASFDQIIDESLSEIYIFDSTTLQFLRVNQGGQNNLGYTSAELSHLTPLDLEQKHSLQNFKLRIEKLHNDPKRRFIFETSYVRQNGSTYPVEVHLQSSNYHGQKVYVAMILDISSRKKAETDKHKLQEKLRQAQKMEAIGTLAGGIAHDFNNILVAIIGFTELARLKHFNKEPITSDLDQVLQAGGRAKELVKQILTFSRKVDQKISPLQPQLIVKEALKMLSSSLPTTVDFKVDIDDHCGVILADPTSIHQIVINLCTNALHALKDEKGTITVQLSCQNVTKSEITEETIAPGLFCKLTVTDTGQGIGPEHMNRIFDPYFTTKEIGKGTGLGLAVIYGIIKECHGFIKVDSELGIGTTFQLFFPAHKEDSPVPEPNLQEELPTGHESILVVDDDPSITNFCTTLLNRLGYKATGLTDSREALALFLDNPEHFALLVTDQTMPKMTGAELTTKIFAIRPDMPIIMCSGYSSVFNKDDAKALKITTYLNKPVALSTLATEVRHALDKQTL